MGTDFRPKSRAESRHTVMSDIDAIRPDIIFGAQILKWLQ